MAASPAPSPQAPARPSVRSDPQLREQVLDVVRRALREDLGAQGDLTTEATVPPELRATAAFLAKSDGVLAGLEIAELVFAEFDRELEVVWDCRDGDAVRRGQVFGRVRGRARSIITAERLALNILQRMSGIATQTRALVEACRGLRVRILDTRKTSPNLRVLEKMATVAGGGESHRMGLFDMVMIKDNHVVAAGGVGRAIERVHAHLAKQGFLGRVRVEVETRTLAEVREALAFADKIDRIMLDNMVVHTPGAAASSSYDVSMLAEAVRLVGGRVPTEASGNIVLENVREVAATGVDYISSGALTHSVRALDISLKIALDASQPPHARL
jgi:nicotinate-nucleotide pyrophosphorylase (carboxylating)